ncbi:Phosphate-regulating neutral endopeptidase [Aphelenchoides bicaudatus]|nr:Phosphate-regulating neutral endopeptidase [Aphelenchoides bicaudatus]
MHLLPLIFLFVAAQAIQFQHHQITSRGLKNAAELLRGSLNESVDPCDSFFDFSCGGWISENPIPRDRSYYDRYTKLSEQISKQVKALYDDPTPSTSLSINKLKNFYHVCMNTTFLNEVKTDVLLNNLEAVGYWPIIHGAKWDPKKFDLTEALIRMARIRALDVFFASYGNVDLNNVSRLLIHFDKGSLGMSIPQFYLDKFRFGMQFSAYKQYMQRIVSLIARDAHSSRSKEELENDVNDIIEFETRFAKITMDSMNKNTGNFSTAFRASRLSDMAAYVPSIDWRKYFLSVMPKEMDGYLSADPEVIIANPQFFILLDKLLKETDNRTLMNVMGWRFSDAYWLQLDERFGSVRHDYMRRVIGTLEQTPRWKECATVLNAAMPYATDAMFIRKFFKRDDFTLVKNMFAKLKKEFIKKLIRTTWMDKTTKAYALQKAHAMIGINRSSRIYLQRHCIGCLLQFGTLKWQPNDSYATIVQKHSLWRQHTSSLNLLKPVDTGLFPMTSITVNAAYTFVRNALTIPGAILQAPFFNTEFPMAMNFGSIGSIIAHEIVHGFDLQGSQFEKNGNRRNWWQPITRKRFEQRNKCIIDQYSQYEVPGTNGLKVDGFASNGENAADNSGIATSYRAYQKFLNMHPDERQLKIPGFEKYSNDQIFYISFAMSYCGHAKREETVRQLFSDNHSPARFRINGVVSNQAEFSKAFNCPASARMNPKMKCSVW